MNNNQSYKKKCEKLKKANREIKKLHEALNDLSLSFLGMARDHRRSTLVVFYVRSLLGEYNFSKDITVIENLILKIKKIMESYDQLLIKDQNEMSKLREQRDIIRP